MNQRIYKRTLWTPESMAVPEANRDDVNNSANALVSKVNIQKGKKEILLGDSSIVRSNERTMDTNTEQRGSGHAISEGLIATMKERRVQGKTTAEIAGEFGVSSSAVRRHAPSSLIPDALRKMSDTNSYIRRSKHNYLDFSRLENRQMPSSVRTAIQLSLDTAAQNAILAEDRNVKGFFEGYLAGFSSALAIVCGAGGIDLSFLEEREHDDRTGITQQPGKATAD